MILLRPLSVSSKETSTLLNAFTVSPRHSKLSVVSKLSPSPDWFTGTDTTLLLCFDYCFKTDDDIGIEQLFCSFQESIRLICVWLIALG